MQKVAFFTFGCKLNFAETSAIANAFAEKGISRVDFNDNPDFYVINTCSVTGAAEKKCRNIIKKAHKQNPNAKLIVTGCYAQLNPEEIGKIEGVDLIVDNNNKFAINSFIEDNIGKHDLSGCDIRQSNNFNSAFSAGDRTRSFLKVQDGCDYFCTYCTIPMARGKSRNPEIKELVEQARMIENQGFKEIVLTGVNIGDFGKSTGETFHELLQELNKLRKIQRIRISSIEPNLLSEDIINLVSTSKIIMPHFHIPLQSGSDKVLKIMKRRYDAALFKERITYIKNKIPHAFIGIDVITGMPGETEQDFTDTYNFLKNSQGSELHVFAYSERPETIADKLPNKVPVTERKERSKTLQELSDELKMNFYLTQKDKEIKVLFENYNKDGKMYGFTDNYIKVKANYNAKATNVISNIKLLSFNKNEFVFEV